MRRSSKSGGGVPAAGVQGGDGKAARKLLRVDVVLVVSSVRAKRGRCIGMTVRPSGGGGEDRRRGVLGGVSARGWRRASLGASVGCRSCGGGPATVVERRRRRGAKYGRVRE
jgi:hypothetical protein